MKGRVPSDRRFGHLADDDTQQPCVSLFYPYEIQCPGMKKHVAILGAGNMGTALGVIAAKRAPVILWSVEPEVVNAVDKRHENAKYLPGVRLASRIRATGNLPDAIRGASLVVVAVPSHIVTSLARALAPLLRRGQIVLNAAKGIDETTLLTMPEILAAALPRAMCRRVATMSGPSIANEFARGAPCAVTVAAADRRVSEAVARAFRTGTFRVEASTDVRGTALGGTLKNIYALLLGMADGLGLGMNAKSALLWAALAEMQTLFAALGAARESAFRLSGVGDLIVTGMSQHSRNRSFGEELCLDPSCRMKMRDPAQTIEGVKAVSAVAPFARKKRLKTPMLFAIERVLFHDEDPRKTIEKLFSSL